MIYKKEYVKCPICKSKKCIREYDYLTYSEKIECSNCKYKISFTYIKDVNGNKIKLDDNKDLTFGNLISKEFLLKIPCGIVISQHIDGEIVGNAIKSEIHQYKSLLQTSYFGRRLFAVLNTTLYRLLDNKITVDVIYEKQNNDEDELPF